MTVLASDSFNRANSTTTLGSTDSYTGGTSYAWSSATTYGISSNQAQKQTGSASANSAAWINPGVSDYAVTATITTLGNHSRLVFRWTADSDCLFVLANGTTNYQIIKRQGSSNTVLASISVVPANGDVIKATCNGSTITVTINGANSTTVTNTFNQTATKVGILTDDSIARIDNFIVEDLAAGGTDATVTAIAATATNTALAPSISGAASITATTATATAQALAPTISGDASITSIVANVTASANAPSIEQVTLVAAVVATVTVQSLVPSVTAERQAAISSVVANCNVAMLIPSVIVIPPTYKKITLEAERITQIQLGAEVRWQIPLQAERVVAIQLQAGGGNLTKENQNFEMYAGDGLDLLFPLTSKKEDLSSASITWTLKDRLGGTVLLTKTVGSGITVVGSSFTVRLDASDTSGREGRFFYVGKITKDGVTSTSVTGHIKINTL